ncbi:MAG TPA: hypothetical protein VNM68_11775, partial [Candidatus Polarisedimenticolia bacterium]|nr:hypothetical protein [Candidatus Polarisedimenticolia bacterium]
SLRVAARILRIPRHACRQCHAWRAAFKQLESTNLWLSCFCVLPVNLRLAVPIPPALPQTDTPFRETVE